MAMFFICLGLSVHVCAMQQRRDCNINIRKLAKVARVENEVKHVFNDMKILEQDIKNVFCNKKRADAVRQDQRATCPTLSAQNKQNTFMRLNALKNANYFSSREFEAIDEKMHARWHEIYLPSISPEQEGLFEEKCELLKEVIKKGMKAGCISETEPNLSPMATILLREIIEERDGGSK